MIKTPQWLENLAKYFQDKNFQFYIVGGAVRNFLTDKDVNEWDCTTDATPSEIEVCLKDFGATGINSIGKRFGTIIASYHNVPVEITTFRTEQYQEKNRNPKVTFGKDLNEDLARRDFTINAIAFDPITKKIFDPYDGQKDLKDKIIRAVGEPGSRFKEDPLRMLRAVRFMVELEFEISPTTLDAITHFKQGIELLSVERISQELDKILLSKKPSQAIRVLVETGLIEYFLPELIPSINLDFNPDDHKDIYHHILTVLDQTPAKLALRWCALLHDIAKPLTRKKIEGEYYFLGHEVVGAKLAKTILRRLKYSNEFINYVTKLVYLHQRLPNYNNDWNDGGIRRFVRDAGETLDDLFIFADADSSTANYKKIQTYRERRSLLRKRISELEKEAEIALIKSPLDGQELMTLFHRQPGPWIKPIKDYLLGLVLDNKLAPDDKKTATLKAKEFYKNN